MKLAPITDPGEPFRYLSVCSGIEAATTAWHPLGWQCSGVAEIEPFPCQVLAQRLGAGRPRYMPDPEAVGLTAKETKARAAAIKAMSGRHMRWGNELVNFGDFTQIREDDVGPIDLLVGGTPCQSFSIAGKRLGLDDPRGNLTLEFLALARRVRPRWLVWENVPGVLSHDDGRTFGTFLGLLAECGFERWAYRVLDAQYVRVGRFGRAVPQRRRRVFVVGYSGTADIHPRAVLLDRESLRGNPAPRREAGQGVACDVVGSLTSSGRGVERAGETRGQDPVVAQAFGGNCTAGPIDVATACNSHGGPHGRLDFESETFVAQQPFSIMPMNSGKDYKARETDVAQPIMAGGPVGGNQGGDFITVPFDTTQITSASNYSRPAAGDPCRPLAAGAHPPAIAWTGDGETADALSASEGKTYWHEGNNFAPHNLVQQARWGVRRLMPIECERLMGFPDNWTQIEWRGKPAEQCPDGPRYKAIGNSKAINVVTWIGERIDAVEAAVGAARHAA